MPFNHSTFNCIKSLLMIYSKLAKVTSKQCLGTISINVFCWVKLFKVIHLVERKISLNFFWICLFNKWKIWWMLSSFWRTTCHGAQLISSNSSKNNPGKTARPYLTTLCVIFLIHLDFPIRFRCVLKGIIHRKKQWAVWLLT